MGACASAPRCRYGGCNRYAVANNQYQGYCSRHYQTQIAKQQQQQNYVASQPAPPPYSPQPIPSQPVAYHLQSPQPQYSPQPQAQQPTVSCPHCRQPLVTPAGVSQLRCPRCQCVFSLSQPTPAVYTPQYQPQVVVVRQPQVIVEPYPVGYGFGGGYYGGGYGYGGGDLALGVGAGLLGGILLGEALDGGFGGGFW